MKTFMTPKENLLAVLKHKEPEWIPCTPHIANLNNIPGQLPAYLLKEPIDRLAISKYLGGDLLYEIGGAKAIHGNTIIIRNIKNEDVLETQYETPTGRLTRKTREAVIPTPVYSDTLPDFSYPPDMRISTVIEHEIKGVQDYNILEYICKNTMFTFDSNIIDKNMALLADGGVAVLSGPSTPFYNLISNSAGLERIVYDLMDHGGEVESLMNAMAEKNYDWYSRAAQTNIEVMRCTKDLDTNLISPELFKKYSVPVLAKYAQICHAHNKILMLHMCGHIRDFLPLVKETGVDAIHCLCPPETGNTPLKLAREILGKEITVMARVDPPVLLSKKPAEISKAVQDMLEEVIPGDNFTVILPCGRAPLENLKAVIGTVKEFGRYPLTR